MKSLVIISRDWEIYKSRFEQNQSLHAHFTLCDASVTPTQSSLSVAEVIVGDPDLTCLYVDECASLEWMQSSWAGNNKLQNMQKHDYLLSGVKGVFGLQMVEYVLSYLLYFTRRIEDFNRVKTNKGWAKLRCNTLADYKIGIMGMGNIGQEVATKLTAFNIEIVGLSRSGKEIAHVKNYTYEDLDLFLQGCDFVVNLLPETHLTVGLCNADFFAKMAPSSVFINAGRGSVIDSPTTIINALNSGHLKAAILDVYEQEPLPSDHPYYITDKIYLSCHTAAMSDPHQVFDVFEKNALRFIQGKELLYLHNFSTGY